MVRMILNQDTYSQKVRSVNILVSIDLLALRKMNVGIINLTEELMSLQAKLIC